MSGQNIGEANKYFRIFTKDFGMVGATVQGVRLLRSKLRYSLQDYSYSKISLVRGKNIWRITGAMQRKNLRDFLNYNRGKFEMLAKTFSLLERLLRGEEKNESLFSHISSSWEFLERESFDRNLLENCEYILVMRILRNLGYMAESKDLSEFVVSSLWTKELVSKMSAVSHNAVSQINKSLKETQL